MVSAQCHRCAARLAFTCGGPPDQDGLPAQVVSLGSGCWRAIANAMVATALHRCSSEGALASTFNTAVSDGLSHDGQSGQSRGERGVSP